MQQSRGFLVAFEGIDGSGKSSLIQTVAQALSQKYIPVVLTKEPGGSQLGKTLRALLQEQPVPIDHRAEFLLFAADRAQHMQEIIKPALAQGKLVLSDRLADSSIVYQGYGRGLDITMIKSVNAWALDGVAPDLTIYVYIDGQTATERVIERGKELTAFEKEAQDFFNKLINGYTMLYKDRSDVLVIDGRQPREVMAQQVYDALFTLYIAGSSTNDTYA
ncbi:MAG: dTMP kinase [Candidatus Babeliales bacterium]